LSIFGPRLFLILHDKNGSAYEMKLPRYNPALLPWIGAASQATLYTWAGVHAYGDWGWLIGPGVGITASLAVATAATSTSGNVSNYRKTLTNIGLALMVLVTPATVALSIALPASWMTAVAWGAAVDVSIVLAGVIAGNRMVAQSEKPVAQSVAHPKKSKKTADQSGQIPAPVALVVAPVAQSAAPAAKYPRKCDYCDEVFQKSNAVGGHMKKHHPELCKPKPIAVGLFQKAEQQ
jgi:hypothetical protein